MPDKRYERKDSKRCLRCWRNRMKHGNKLKKKAIDEYNNNETKRRQFIETDYVVRYNPHRINVKPWRTNVVCNDRQEALISYNVDPKIVNIKVRSRALRRLEKRRERELHKIGKTYLSNMYDDHHEDQYDYALDAVRKKYPLYA